MQPVQLLGLDLGSKRTGIAMASSVARLASPFKVVPTPEVLQEIGKLMDEHRVEAVVVGLPRNLNGEDTAQTEWVRRWVDKSKAHIRAPIYLQDEALTSKVAGSKKSLHIDAEAAAIILQDFLDAKEERVAV